MTVTKTILSSLKALLYKYYIAPPKITALMDKTGPPRKNHLTLYILIAMVLGIITGYLINRFSPQSTRTTFSNNIKLLTTIFLRLVQMIIAPLVFSTLVVGIAKLGDLKTVGRVGGKSLLWFVSASIASLLLGMMLVNFFKPGAGIHLGGENAAAAKDLIGKTEEFSLQKFVEHVVPKSVFEAMAANEILQLVIFSIFFGVATAALGDYGKIVIKALDAVAHIILKMVTYVMNFAPLGVFGAISAVIATNGLDIFRFYGFYFAEFILGILLLWIVLLTVGFLVLGKRLPV